MIDIKILRTNPELVRQAITQKSAKVNLEEVLALDEKRLALKKRIEEIRAERNKLSETMGKGKPSSEDIATSKRLKEELERLEAEWETVEQAFLALFKKIPNIPSQDTPVGFTEEENVVAKIWGDIPQFPFAPKNHAEIAEARGWIDKERASRVSGSRFAYLK